MARRVRLKLAHRQCGTCTECCTWGVVPELDKPMGVKCQHLIYDGRVGCSIYEARPETCSGYYCLWLAEGSKEAMRKLSKRERRQIHRQLAETDRPDKIGIIFDFGIGIGGSFLRAREIRPGALEDPRARLLIEVLSKKQDLTVIPYDSTEGD